MRVQGSKTRTRVLAALEVILDLLVDRNAAGPAGRRVRAALDVAGEQLDAGEQAAHAAHVVVTVAAHLVAQPFQHQHPVLERLERRHDFLQLKIAALFLRPEGGRNGAVRAEHDDQPLAGPCGRGEPEAGQAQKKRQRGGGETDGLDELAAAKLEAGHERFGFEGGVNGYRQS
jgi:hypothetical protein